MRTAWLVIATVLAGCNSEGRRHAAAESLSAERENQGQMAFIARTSATSGWWDSDAASGLTIDVQRRVRELEGTTVFLAAYVNDLVELDSEPVVVATAVSDAPEAVYLLSLSEHDLRKLRNDVASGDSLKFEEFRCAAKLGPVTLNPVGIEADGSSNSRWVNLVQESRLLIRGNCVEIELVSE